MKKKWEICLAIVLFLLTGIEFATLAFVGRFILFSPPGGLYGTYYRNTDWQGEPWKTQVLDPEISHHAPEFQRVQRESQNRFSAEWTGYLDIPQTAEYQFLTESDDGSWLWIDDKLVVDNGGMHGLQKVGGQIHLAVGLHKITLRYVQFGGEAIFRVLYAQRQSGFTLTKISIGQFRKNGIPEEVVKHLKSLKWRTFATEQELLKAVEAQIGKENTVKYHSQIVNHAQQYNQLAPLPANALFPPIGDFKVYYIADRIFPFLTGLWGLLFLCFSFTIRNKARFWTIFVVSACIVNLVFIAAIFRKGFFHWDSGLMMLALEDSNIKDLQITAAVTMIPRLIFWTPPDVITYRVVRFVVDMALGGFVYFAFCRWLKTFPEQMRLQPLELVVGAGLVLVGSSSYPMLIQAWPFGHHELLQWAAMLTTGGFLLWLNTQSKKAVALLGGGVGFIVGWTFFIKFPTVFLLSGVFLLACWLTRPSKPSRFNVLAVCFLAGIALAIIAFFAFIQSPAQWLKSIEAGLLRLNLMGAHYAAKTQASRYLKEIGELVKTLTVPYFLFLLAGFGVLYSSKLRKFKVFRYKLLVSRIDVGQLFAGIIAAFPVCTLLYYLLLKIPEWRGKAYFLAWVTLWPYVKWGCYLSCSYPMLVLLLLASAIAAGVILRGRPLSWQTITHLLSRRWTSFVVFGVLIVMPAVVAIGSNQKLILYMRENIWSWILLLLALAAWTRSRMRAGLRLWIFFLLPYCVMSAQQYYAARYLYGTFKNIANYRYAVNELPKGKEILFNKEEAEYYRYVYRILAERSDYSPGDYILGLYNLPNLVYLVGGRSPGTGAYYSADIYGETYNVELMKRFCGPELADTFIITNQSIAPELVEVMHIKGAMFPETYKEIGELVEYGTQQSLKIYAPKHRLR